MNKQIKVSKNIKSNEVKIKKEFGKNKPTLGNNYNGIFGSDVSVWIENKYKKNYNKNKGSDPLDETIKSIILRMQQFHANELQIGKLIEFGRKLIYSLPEKDDGPDGLVKKQKKILGIPTSNNNNSNSSMSEDDDLRISALDKYKYKNNNNNNNNNSTTSIESSTPIESNSTKKSIFDKFNRITNPFNPSCWELILYTMKYLSKGDYNAAQMYASVIKEEFGEEWIKLKKIIFGAKNHQLNELKIYHRWFEFDNRTIMVDLWLPLVKEEVKKAEYNKWGQKVMFLFFIYELECAKLV